MVRKADVSGTFNCKQVTVSLLKLFFKRSEAEQKVSISVFWVDQEKEGRGRINDSAQTMYKAKLC